MGAHASWERQGRVSSRAGARAAPWQPHGWQARLAGRASALLNTARSSTQPHLGPEVDPAALAQRQQLLGGVAGVPAQRRHLVPAPGRRGSGDAGGLQLGWRGRWAAAGAGQPASIPACQHRLRHAPPLAAHPGLPPPRAIPQAAHWGPPPPTPPHPPGPLQHRVEPRLHLALPQVQRLGAAALVRRRKVLAVCAGAAAGRGRVQGGGWRVLATAAGQAFGLRSAGLAARK